MAALLVVDDDDDIRDLMAHRLRMDDHDVTSTGDPQGALALAASRFFDVAILDWSMPVMNGGELCARLRDLPHLRNMPILILTAHADAATRRSAESAGATAYMTKPFSVRELAATVRSLVASVPDPDPSGPSHDPSD